MKRLLFIFGAFALYFNVLTAQDPVVISRLSNTQVVVKDSIIVVSTLGEPFGGIYEQNGLVINFEPFPFLLFGSGPSATRDLPAITDLKVYPNPVSDIAVLQRDGTKDRYLITLYLADGSLIHKSFWEAGAGNVTLALEQYARGIYILIVTDEELTKASHFKIVKQ
ncbi:MAG TPA: T9SS type A sorting domain-containing protein [Saprospiraceae bacterium]|nr:T9SS type A sorting domain-containing protein [Saprospiraceae bacterium]